jgi:hypothetical protein
MTNNIKGFVLLNRSLGVVHASLNKRIDDS